MSDLKLEGLTDAQKRLFAVRCARRVQDLMTDPRSISALDVAERHARGEATDDELAAVEEAAWDASWDAAVAGSRSAARAAAGAAAWDAAWAAARDAAWAAGSAAAWAAAGASTAAATDAGMAAAGDAAWDAERFAQLEILEQIRKEVKP